MALLQLVRVSVGQVAVAPGSVKMISTDNLATITTAGYLNGVGNQLPEVNLSPLDVIECLYSYNQLTGTASYAILLVSISNGLITLTSWDNPNSEPLPSGQLFVGNASNIAQARAMSGDGTISNTGVFTVANDAITTAKILNANVTLAKLASGIAPSHVIKFAGQVTTVGGSATEAFTVTGAVGATDRAFVQMVDNGTNNVTVLQAVVTNNTLTVTFSANPGNDAVINYQLIRAAS